MTNDMTVSSRAEALRILVSAIQHLTAPIEDMTARHLLWRAYYELVDGQQIAVRSYHRSKQYENIRQRTRVSDLQK